jgi:hypothetical protein
VGDSSYHFVSEEEGIFIVEHPEACTKIKNREKGTVLPNRVYLRNVTFTDKFTFRGQIFFGEDYGVTLVTSLARVDVYMKFDTSSMCCVENLSRGYTSDNTASFPWRQVAHTNAGLLHHFQSLVKTQHGIQKRRYLQEYYRAAIPRLKREAVSTKTLANLSEICHAAMNPNNPDSFDFNLT